MACQEQALWLIGPIYKLQRKWSIENTAPSSLSLWCLPVFITVLVLMSLKCSLKFFDLLTIDEGNKVLWIWSLILWFVNKFNNYYIYQGILKGEVSLYHWPPVWLVWNHLYDFWQFLFLFAKQTHSNQSNRRSTAQWYSPPLAFPVCIIIFYIGGAGNSPF